MEASYVQLVVLSIISYLITYLIGHAFVSFIKTPKEASFINEFLKLTSGFYAVFTAYAIFRTNCITINIGIVALFVMLMLWLKRNKYLYTTKEAIRHFFSVKTTKYILIQLIMVALVFTVLWLKIINPVTGSVHQVYSDFYTYAKIIQHISKTGFEGNFVDWHSGVEPIRNLYHYGELWYAAFYAAILKQTPFNAFYFQLFTHSLVIYFVGACALIELFIQPKSKLFYLSGIVIFFVCGISFYLPKHTLFTRGDWWDNSLLFQPKYFFPAIFVFYALICGKLKKWIPLVLIAMAVIIACNVVAPALFMTTGLMLLFLMVSKEIDRLTFMKGCGIIAFAVFFIALYTVGINYLNEKNAALALNHNETTVPFNLSLYLRTAFNCFAGQLIKSTLSMLPFAVLFLIAIRKYGTNNLTLVFVLIILLHVMSIIAYAIFSNRVDAVQLWTNVYVPLSAVICFFMMIHVLNGSSLLLKGFVLLLIPASFFQAGIIKRASTINKSYLTKISKIYHGEDAVFFKSEKDVSSVFSKNINLYAPSPYLIMNYKEYNPVCLSVFEIPFSDNSMVRNSEKEIIENSVFYKFVQLQKQHNHFVSIEKSQQDFLDKYKVKYAFTYPNSPLPKYLQDKVEFAVKDSIERITLYKLKN